MNVKVVPVSITQYAVKTYGEIKAWLQPFLTSLTLYKNGQFHTLVILTLGKEPILSTGHKDRWVLESQSGHCEEEISPLPLLGIKSSFVTHRDGSLETIASYKRGTTLSKAYSMKG
jgi:hypothetical protein